MTHDDLRSLLPRYATGGLDDAAADAVRAHIAGGCVECLERVFQLPMDPPPPPPTAPPVVARVAGRASRASRAWLLFLGALALALAAATGWMIGLLRTHEAERQAEATRTSAQLAALDRARGELETRARAADDERAEAEAEARRQAEAARERTEAARASAEASAELARRLEGAEARVAELARGLRGREVEISRLIAGAEVRALGDLAATPGVQVLRLSPAPSVAEARGHVLWHPARERIVLYVFDLPADGRYRVRLRLDDGVAAAGPVLRLRAGGEAVAAIELGVRAARLRDVEVVREPSDERVLEGRL